MRLENIEEAGLELAIKLNLLSADGWTGRGYNACEEMRPTHPIKCEPAGQKAGGRKLRRIVLFALSNLELP
jgi:hypothetical protein